MANALIQVRIDEKLKTEATDIFEKLGLDLSTAIRIFLTRSVQERGIPFSMILREEEYKAEAAVDAMKDLSREARENGIGHDTLGVCSGENYESMR